MLAQQLDLRDPRHAQRHCARNGRRGRAEAQRRGCRRRGDLGTLPPTPAARRNHLVVLKFGTKGWVELSRRLEEKGRAEGRPDVVKRIDNRPHRPGVLDASLLLQPELTDRQWNEICRPIVVSVRSYFLDILRKSGLPRSNGRTGSCRTGSLPPPAATCSPGRALASISTGRSVGSPARPEKRAVVAVGPGGVGKTTQVALSLQAVLGAPRTCRSCPWCCRTRKSMASTPPCASASD